MVVPILAAPGSSLDARAEACCKMVAGHAGIHGYRNNRDI